MSDGDPFWGAPGPQPTATSKPKRPPAVAVNGGWSPPADSTQVYHRRALPKPPLPGVLAGVSLTIALVLAVGAWTSRPQTDAPGTSESIALRTVTARVSLPAGDVRTLEQVCGDFDVPAALCELSNRCSAALAERSPHQTAGGGRVVVLFLRSPGTSCDNMAEGHAPAAGTSNASLDRTGG